MMQDKFFIISKLGIYLKYFPFSMMRTRYQFLSWPLLLISAFFLLGIFFVAKDAFAQVSSCPGIASTQLSPDGNYKATAFGCVEGWTDPNDNCIPAKQPPECSGMSGPDCERKLNWYAANVDVFGVNKKVLVTRPDTGKSVVVMTIDIGPACSRELANGPLIDLSYSAATYLGNGGGGNYETVSAKAVADDTPLGPTDGSGISTLPSTGNGTTTGGGGSYSLSLKVRLKPGTKDTYLINRATAQAYGGGSASAGTGQGAPAGSVDANCKPTGTLPSDPGAELKNKYNINTEGFSSAGIINIYEMFTCISTSKVPTLLNGVTTTVHSGISPSLGSIGMDCNATCNVWIPEGTNAFKFILTHEFGHVINIMAPRGATHSTELSNAWSQEGGLSPYSGPYYGGQGGCPVKGDGEDYAEMVAYYLNPTLGGKTGACDSRDDPKNSLFEDTHFPLHLAVAKQVL